MKKKRELSRISFGVLYSLLLSFYHAAPQEEPSSYTISQTTSQNIAVVQTQQKQIVNTKRHMHGNTYTNNTRSYWDILKDILPSVYRTIKRSIDRIVRALQ